jgi:hypothetical protein
MSKVQTLFVLKIDQFPTSKENQKSNKNYICSYEIFDTLKSNDDLNQKIKNELTNASNYSDDEKKRCVFLASYAIITDEKLCYILSESPCGKIKKFDSNFLLIGEPDLTNNNQLEVLINSIKPK